MIGLALAANAADLWLSWGVITTYGIEAEANPLMKAALSMGLLGGIAVKSALLSLIMAGAALNPKRARLLLAAGIAAGTLGALSACLAS